MIENLKLIVIAICLILACKSDLKDRRISNKLVLILLMAGLFFSLYENELDGIKTYIQSIGVSLVFTILPYITRNLSAGDVKLFVSVSSFYSPFNTLILIFCFYSISFLSYFFWVVKNFLFTKKFKHRIKMPYAPIITLSYLCFLIFILN